MIRSSVKNFDLIPKGTEKLLMGKRYVKFSLLIHHPKYNTGLEMRDKKRCGKTGSKAIPSVL